MRARYLALSLLLGCATGSSIDEDSSGLDGDDDGVGIGGHGGHGDGGGHQSTSSATTGSGSGSGSGSGGGGGGSTGGGSSGGGGAGDTGGGGGGVCDFSSPNTCASAQSLASVSGDDGGTTTVKGNTSKWVTIHVTEDDSGVFETDLSYTVTLTSPPGMLYDLVVHQGPQDGAMNCAAAPKLGQPADGAVQTVSDSWDDDQGIGGEDDSLWLNIEIVHVSGDDCAAEWTLKIQGG
jgi:hypothetical protein